MLIDWFTVAAQIINFVVLVALMKHFLYGRLLRAIDAREQRIAKQLAESEQKAQEAKNIVNAAHKEAGEIRGQRDEMLADAKQQADREYKDLLQKARDSVRTQERKWREDLEREKSAYFAQVRSRATEQILGVTKRALVDLACVDLQRCAVKAFVERLQSIDSTNLGPNVTLQSGYDLPPETRREIDEALHRRLGEVRLTFERVPEMAWGLELRSNGRRIGWNPESYIGSLEESLRHTLEHNSA